MSKAISINNVISEQLQAMLMQAGINHEASESGLAAALDALENICDEASSEACRLTRRAAAHSALLIFLELDRLCVTSFSFDCYVEVGGGCYYELSSGVVSKELCERRGGAHYMEEVIESFGGNLERPDCIQAEIDFIESPEFFIEHFSRYDLDKLSHLISPAASISTEYLRELIVIELERSRF